LGNCGATASFKAKQDKTPMATSKALDNMVDDAPFAKGKMLNAGSSL
jgi:hypothetical protein